MVPMTGSPGDVSRRLSRLIRQVLDDPRAVDHTELWLAASAFLDVAPTDDRAAKARRMAAAAMELGVFMTSAHFAALQAHTLAFANSV